MGLDNGFGYKDPFHNRIIIPFCQFDPPLRLVRGLVISFGDEDNQLQFRGRRYDSFIQEVTGQSLYQVEVHKDVVKEMAQKLNKLAEDQVALDVVGQAHMLELSQCQDLVRVFDAAAKNDCTLFGWW